MGARYAPAVSGQQDTPESKGLFERNLPLCDGEVRKFERQFPGLAERGELESWAREGLMEASRRYDPDRGVPFHGFAHYRIRGAIIDGVRRNGAVPRRTYQRLKALAATHSYSTGLLADVFVSLPADTSAAEHERRLQERLADMATSMALSMAAPLLGTAATPVPPPDEVVGQAQLLEMVERELDTLTDVEATLLRRHYLAEEGLETIAVDLGLSKSWASRVLARAVGKLTKRMKARA